MANLLNKDPFAYHQEYTEFIRELREYHTNRGTPFIKIPQIAGRDVDLYLLYRRVIALGGWQKVNDEQNWDEFLEEFYVPKGCTNGIQALKQIYIRFLNEYEKVNFLGEDPDHEIMDDDEDGPSRKKSSTPLHSVPLTYKYSQHKVSDNIRQSSGLSCQFVTFSDYEKLEMALLSGLPNEVDFVVNVCTLLSNDGKRSLRLDKSKHLLDLLLAHIGIFNNGEYSLESIYQSGWKPLSNRNFVKFWYDTVHDKEVREMISDTRDASHLRQWVGEEVLNLGRDLGVNDVEGQRVTQMAIIVRNLSFDEENMQVLASNRNVFRFLLLCIYSKYGSLRQIGLDTLGNSALQMVLESVDHPDTQLILRLVSKCLSSSDKCEVVRGLEILSKLCQVEENESLLSEHLESKAYEDICKLLTVHDIQLIIYTLEALYQLSELGESTANAIASVKHAVDILVQLVTVEAQSYGPNSLIGIKVVEFVPHQSAGGTTVGPPVPPQPPPPLAMSSKVIPPPGAPPSPEIETTCNWLRANIELKDGSYMSHLSLYTDYLTFCKKFSLPNPLNSSVLHTCVKAVFPNVDEKIIERKDGNKDIQFSGFSKRQTPLPFAITWQVDKPPSIHSSHGFQRASNSSQSCLTHTPTLRQRLLEPPLVPLQPDSCPPFPAGSSSTHSSQVPGVQHATMTVGTNPVTPHTPKSHHVQSSQQKHCAKLLQSPGTPLRTTLASPSASAPSTPVNRPLVVSSLPSLVSSSPAGKTVSVLQQQLRSPIAQQSSKLQDSALSPQNAASPNQHYPCIQHALHNEQDQNANQGSLRQQSRPNMQGKNSNISFQDNGGTAGRNSSDTNLIKSLLAKKLNQNRGTQNSAGQQYQCHESPASNATSVCNAPPSPARSDAAVSQDDFPMLETKPCTKAPLQTGGAGWTQQQQQQQQHPIDSPAQSDTMESQTSISQDSQYTDDQSSMETKATEQVIGKEQMAQEVKCDGSLQEESMEVDTTLPNSQPKSLESGQITSQESLKEQPAGDVQSTTPTTDGNLPMQAKEPSSSVPVSTSVQNSHVEDQSTVKNTPQQSHLQLNPDASKSSVSSEPIVIQAAQQLEQHPLVVQPSSKLNNPQQKSAELVIQVGSETSMQQQEVVIQPATDQLNNEDLVIQAQLQDQQDVMQPMTSHQQGEQFVIQGSQILIQQPPTQQQLLIQVPAQPAQPIQPAQQLVIQTTPPAPAQQTQQLVIQVPPQQQQFVIQAQQSSSSSPQAQQQFQQQIVIHDLPEDSSQEMTSENQQFEGLQQSNFSQQSPVQFGQDQIQLLGQSQLPTTCSQSAATTTTTTTNANTLYSQPQKSVYQPVDNSLQQNQVVIQYQPVSQSGTTASLPILPKVSPASPGEASLDSSLSPQTLTKCVFQSQGPLFPSSQNIQLENSQKSKKGRTSPVNKNTSVHTCRAMVKSTVPKQKLTQSSDSTIPLTSSPCSPRAFELEVCGEVECAKDIVKEGAEARIERVENKCLRLFDRPVEPSNVENTESSQAPGVVGNAKELPDSSISPKGGTGGNLDKSAKARKRIRNNTGSVDSRCSSAGSEFVCEWANCKRCFESSKSVYSHVYSAHVVTESDGVCKWEGCEKLERKKWSLVTHIQDQHCSEAALRAASQRRIQSAQMNLSGAVAHAAPPTQSQPPPPLQVSPAAASVSAPCVATPGSGASGVVGTGVAAAAAPGTANLVYPPDAAIQAIRRFSARPPFPELMPTNHVTYPVHYQRYDFKPRNPDYIFMEMQFNNNPVFQVSFLSPDVISPTLSVS
ncbi:ARID2 [Acanthosepion pharaonis]|uniref:ARID2 n=1 Tax=Acanthosepion pharaonis TaxID=158019 RepID=A0A812DCP7_ACAPH|nr:ARID2 [Sepia pharaonis]